MSLQSRKRSRLGTPPDYSSACSHVPLPGAAHHVTLLTLLNRKKQYPIYKHLTKCLHITDILKLSRTCRELSTLYKDLQLTQWNINKGLGRFVKDPLALRTLLGKNDALISGSFALQFFDRVLWPGSDLDIVIAHGDGVAEVADYLINVEGYSFISSSSEIGNYEIFMNLDQARTYRKGDRQIQLIVSWTAPVQAILSGYYTTAVVNFISWNTAYAVFARPTFVHYDTYPLKDVNDYFGPLFAKYSARGWRLKPRGWIQDDLTIRTLRNITNLHGYYGRRVGDKFTWKMPLDIAGVGRPSTPDFLLDNAYFEIRPPAVKIEHGTRASYIIRTANWVSPVLRYQYTFAWSAIWFKIGNFLAEATYLQMHKMKPEERPADYFSMPDLADDYQIFHRLELKRPAGWDYFDDEMPKMIDHLLREEYGEYYDG